MSDGPEPFDEHAHRRRAHDRIFDQKDAFAFEHLREGRIFRLGLSPAGIAPFDKGPAAVPVAHKPFQAWNPKFVRHAVGGRLARIGNGHDDRIGVQGNAVLILKFLFRQHFSEPFARKIDALAV